jgi:hypothetical protein
MESKLKEAIEFLEDMPEVQGSPMQVDDISWAVDNYLYEESKEALKKKVKNIHGRNYTVRFFGLKGPSIDIEGNAKKLAKLINDTCSTYQVLGCLAKPMKIDLYFGPETNDSEPMSCYICYLAFTYEAAEVIDKLMKLDKDSAFFDMGAVPKEIK